MKIKAAAVAKSARVHDTSSVNCIATNGTSRSSIVARTTPRTGLMPCKNRPAKEDHPTLVAIHQVVPPLSLTPPRLSSSCFFRGSWTDSAPAARALA